jgi:hypothetical protein
MEASIGTIEKEIIDKSYSYPLDIKENDFLDTNSLKIILKQNIENSNIDYLSLEDKFKINDITNKMELQKPFDYTILNLNQNNHTDFRNCEINLSRENFIFNKRKRLRKFKKPLKKEQKPEMIDREYLRYLNNFIINNFKNKKIIYPSNLREKILENPSNISSNKIIFENNNLKETKNLNKKLRLKYKIIKYIKNVSIINNNNLENSLYEKNDSIKGRKLKYKQKEKLININNNFIDKKRKFILSENKPNNMIKKTANYIKKFPLKSLIKDNNNNITENSDIKIYQSNNDNINLNISNNKLNNIKENNDNYSFNNKFKCENKIYKYLNFQNENFTKFSKITAKVNNKFILDVLEINNIERDIEILLINSFLSIDNDCLNNQYFNQERKFINNFFLILQHIKKLNNLENFKIQSNKIFIEIMNSLNDSIK